MPKGQTRFDPNIQPHAHLLCMKCGSIRDWMDPIMPELIARVSDEANFTIIGSSLDLKGICDRCEKRGESQVSRAEASQ